MAVDIEVNIIFELTVDVWRTIRTRSRAGLSKTVVVFRIPYNMYVSQAE